MTSGYRRVLYSPGFGAGWTSWTPEHAAFALEYEPIIEFLSGGGKFVRTTKGKGHGPDNDWEEPGASILAQFLVDLGSDDFYLGGAVNLKVEYGNGRVRVDEYDGNESLVWEGHDDEGWL